MERRDAATAGLAAGSGNTACMSQEADRPAASRSASTHTQGEWYVEESPNGSVIVWARVSGNPDEDKYVIAVATVGPLAQRLADARLIAAAPDLLEACKAAEEWLSGWASAEPYLTTIRAALSRATGSAT